MTEPGPRERRKRRTRDAIRREAMRLFRERGYDATTIEQIAGAADVSASTFFRYFPTKEDVVLMDDCDRSIARLLTERPGDEPAVAAVRNAIMEAARAALAEDEKLIRDRLAVMLSVPAIRVRMWETGDLFRAALGRRTGHDPDSFEIGVAANAMLGALATAVTRWATEPDADLAELVGRAFGLVEAGLKL